VQAAAAVEKFGVRGSESGVLTIIDRRHPAFVYRPPTIDGPGLLTPKSELSN